MAVMGPQPRVDHSRTDFISRACCLNRRATPSGSEKQFSICPSHTAYPAGHCLTAPYISRNFPQLAGCAALGVVGTTSRPPKWIKPQLTRLVDEAPAGAGWLHEIKYDGYRMHARIDGGKATLLTRTGLDWSHRYRRTIEALGSLKVKSAYLDGELCALDANGAPVFSRLQAAMDEGRTDQRVFFAFDLLFLNGESPAQLPLIKRKERLQRLFKNEIGGLRYSEHVAGDGPGFHCGLVNA